jgi:hypothetical protein
MSARRAGLHHLDLATHPGPGLLDRMPRSRVTGPHGLEETKDVFRTRGGPQRQEAVIVVREGPTAADRHEAWVPDLRKDHVHESYR